MTIRPAPGAASATRGSTLRLTVLLPVLGGLAITVLALVLTTTLRTERAGYLAEAALVTRNLARVLEEQTARSIQTIELALGHVADLWTRMPAGRAVGDAEATGLLRARLAEVGGARAMFIVNAQGRIVHDSEAVPALGMDVSDREYFRQHRTGSLATDALYVGKPIESRATGRPFLPMSRRLTGADGAFAGVVVAIVEPRYFERVFASVDVGLNGLINLRHWDGELIARVPHREAAIGRVIPSTAPIREELLRLGTAAGELRSIFDGVDRIYTARRVPGRPLIVWVGVSETDVLSPWYRSLTAYSVVGVAFAATIAWLTWLLMRELRSRERLMRSVERSESLLRQVVETLPVGVSMTERDGTVSMMNAAAERLHGPARPGKPLEPVGWWTHSGQRVGAAEWALARALRTSEPALNEMVDILAPDGSRRTILHSAVPIFTDHHGFHGAIAVDEDLTAQRDLVASLRESEARYQAMFENSIDAILLARPDGRILSANPEACRSLGYDEAALLAMDRERIVDPASPGLASMIEERDRTGRVKGEVTMVRRDGSRFPAELSSSLFIDRSGERKVVVVMRDITERKQSESRIHYLAFHDGLTGLPNRTFFDRRLRERLDAGTAPQAPFALMLVDLDGFKLINDTLGHEVGDLLLKEVADRLRGEVDASDLVARLGGDEFVVLLDEPADTARATDVANRILATTARPFALAGQELHLTASIGISMHPRDGDDARTLLKSSDLAMYRAKEHGRNRLQFFSEEMNIRSRRRLTLESALRRALAQNELRLQYQPRLDLRSGRLTGVEALLRWQPPDGPAVEPGEFIPVAEETGMILAIGDWVLHEAAAQCAAWRAAGVQVPLISVNLSARQLTDERLPGRLAEALARAGGDTPWLELELTESTVMRNVAQSSELLTRFRDLGVRIAVDDFGTGYSSLSYLSRLPIDCVKIDGSFIRDVPHDPDDTAIVRGIVVLAHTLRLTVVAEGVETREQLEFLRELGCDEIQGFLVSRPMPPAELDLPRLTAVSLDPGALDRQAH